MSSNNVSQPDTFHRRAKTSVLANLSFIHKRTPSAGATLSTATTPTDEFVTTPVYEDIPYLPQDHPHQRALGELHQNQQSQPPVSYPKKSREATRPTTGETGSKPLHKKTLSSISLKSLAGKDPEKKPKDKSGKPKKTKSSTNLTNLLSRPKSSRSSHRQEAEDSSRILRDKENRCPPDSAVEARPPPIYAQFSSEHFAKQPLGGKFLEDEIDKYTPENYSPGKQRNFYQGPGQQPTLNGQNGRVQRPKSTYLPSSFSLQDLGIGRRVSNGSRHSAELMRRVSGGKRPSFERETIASSNTSQRSDKGVPNRGSRVMAAVSALGGKATQTFSAEPGYVLSEGDVDRQFEAMLDRRNIPEHQRGNMRKLGLTIKKDFIKQDWAETAGATSKNGRSGINGSDSSADATSGAQDDLEVKKKRPRSRTFTLSRSTSKDALQEKKDKKDSQLLGRNYRNKSSDSVTSGPKSLTGAGAAVAQNLIAKAKGLLPEDFVAYLRKVQKPELVEVGRLHKLRLLLRNETVAWTDDFIRQGGMEEIVSLLHRTLAVEWREEHEDLLLHEVLLCLKALSTTGLALEHLNNIQSTLFPALLHMIFDEEKKGPSEFTTRNIVTSLLFTWLKSAPLAERASRARTLLSYLRDPEQTEEERPVGFVLEMRRERPYRVWDKEVTNVTKEVFWIFLHNLNVISLPKPGGDRGTYDTSSSTISSADSRGSYDGSNPHHNYMAKHFPQERPPVPAAPYVGGVEWDATNYLASHLDILNGIMACLPTRDERNSLRGQMIVSGWEKCMGGTLRTCKEKFYGGVHAGLRSWVAAAADDGWDTKDVRCGPSADIKKSPRKPAKANAQVEEPPKIDFKMDFLGSAGVQKKVVHDAWL